MAVESRILRLVLPTVNTVMTTLVSAVQAAAIGGQIAPKNDRGFRRWTCQVTW